jgi:iron complex outermembrane receptor protein
LLGLGQGWAEDEVLIPPVTVRAGRAEEEGDADPRAAEAERALEEPGFVTVVRLEGTGSEGTSIAEALAEAVGTHVRTLGGLGSFASISLRGSPAGQTEVLIDGVPLSRISFSAVDLGSLDPATFDRVEIHRGGAPVALGGAVLGGAVNFVTSIGPGPDGRRTSIGAGGGSFGARRVRAMRRDAFGQWRTTVGVGYAGAEGDFDYFHDGGTPLEPSDDGVARRRNNGYDQIDGVARARRGSTHRYLEVGERVAWKGQGVPGAAGVESEDASLATVRNLVDGRVHLGGAFGISSLDVDLLAHGLVERQRFLDRAGEIGLASQDRVVLTLAGGATAGARVQLSPRQLVSFAVQGRFERLREEDRLGGSETVRGGRLGGAVTCADEWAIGVPGQEDALVLLPAVRLDVLATSGEGVTRVSFGAPESRTDHYLSPRLGARWRVVSGFAVKANVGRYFRPPTVVELFGDRGFVAGNPELAPETGTTFDVGFVIAPERLGPLDRLYLEAAFFRAEPENLIALLPTSGQVARARNLGDVRLAGHELAWSARLLRTATLTGNYTFVDSAQRSDLISFDGRRLPGRPRYEVYARLELARRLGARGPRGGLWLDMTVVSGSFLDAANLNEVPARRFLGAGARIEPKAGLAFTVEGKNLLDERVEEIALASSPRPGLDVIPRAVSDVLGYPLPGRALWASGEFSF